MEKKIKQIRSIFIPFSKFVEITKISFMEMETVFDANTASVLLTIPRFNEILRVSIEQALNFVQINRALSRNDDSSDEEGASERLNYSLLK